MEQHTVSDFELCYNMLIVENPMPLDFESKTYIFADMYVLYLRVTNFKSAHYIIGKLK